MLIGLLVLTGLAGCHSRPRASATPTDAVLRVGVGGLSLQAPQAGVRQVVANLSLEGLINLNEDGRPRPFLAESWKTADDGLTLTVRLHPHATFHDGTAVTAAAVVPVLRGALPRAMASAYEDVADIRALNDSEIEFRLRQPSPLLLEALETMIQKAGKDGASVGPFVPIDSPDALELRAYPAYYQGRPAIERIVVNSYPSVRAAWAELLRGGLDMLYEVNVDALDSLESSSAVAVLSFVRHYQYMILFGTRTPVFKSADLRRELNAAIDRRVLVRDGLNGHGIPSSGPVPPRHWALDKAAPRLGFDPAIAAGLARHHLRFTCLVPADSVYERIALTVKRELAAAGVDMQVQEITQEQTIKAAASNDFEAMLVDAISGPSLFRSYRMWHSGGGSTTRTISSPLVDAALDRIRHAASDDEYRAGVTAFQQAIVDDPPAVFLAWGERARAVSRRFEVPVPEDGRDALATLRLWRPDAEKRVASN